MSRTLPLLTPMTLFDLLEKTPTAIDTRSVLEHAVPLVFLKRAASLDSPELRVTMILLRLLQNRSRSLYQHSLRVRRFSKRMAELLLLSSEEKASLATAALLHDIGKMDLPDELLQKPERLTPDEFEQVKQHSLSGARILSWMKLPDPIVTLVYHHHEHWNGSGYPDGLAGDAIPLGARIIALCDAFDVMTNSNRPYQVPRTPFEALEELRRCAGSQFDPLLVSLFSHLPFLHMPTTYV